MPAAVPLVAQTWLPWVESSAVKNSSLPTATGAERVVTVAPKLIAVNDSIDRISRPSICGRRSNLRRRAREAGETPLNGRNMDDHPSW